MGLDQDAPAPVMENPAPAPTAGEQVTQRGRWQALLETWQGQTVAVLALPDLSALGVCQGEEVFLFRREMTEGYDDFLRGLLAPEIPKVGYNIKDVMSRALTLGFAAEGFLFDGALAASAGPHRRQLRAGQGGCPLLLRHFPPRQELPGYQGVAEGGDRPDRPGHRRK